MKDAPILTAREVRHLTRLHAHIGALLASHDAAAKRRRRPRPAPKSPLPRPIPRPDA